MAQRFVSYCLLSFSCAHRFVHRQLCTYTFVHHCAMADVEQAEQGEKPWTKSHTVKVIESHMASSYEESAVATALEAVHKHKQYKDIASHVKHQFDKKYPGSGKATEGVFHCICGKSFASKCKRLLRTCQICRSAFMA